MQLFYFTETDRAFAECLDFMKKMANSEGRDKDNIDQRLVPFVRSIGEIMDTLSYRHQMVMVFQAISANPATLSEKEAWQFVRQASSQKMVMGITAGLEQDIRSAVFKMWYAASEYLFRHKMKELEALLNYPQFEHFMDDIRPTVIDAITGMKNLYHLASTKSECTELTQVAEQLVHDLSLISALKSYMDILWTIILWNQQFPGRDHIVVNVLHHADHQKRDMELLLVELRRMGKDIEYLVEEDLFGSQIQ